MPGLGPTLNKEEITLEQGIRHQQAYIWGTEQSCYICPKDRWLKFFFLPILSLYITRWVMTDLKLLYITHLKPGAMPFLPSIFGLSRGYNLMRLLGISPLEFTQAGLYLFGHFSAPNPAPLPLLLLFLLSLLLSKTLSVASSLFHPPVRLLTTFSQPGVAIECPLCVRWQSIP